MSTVGQSCSSTCCSFLRTGIVPLHCCMMCSKSPGSHGRRCRKITTAEDLVSISNTEYEPLLFDRLLKQYLKGRSGVYVGDIPPDIKDKRFPKSAGVVRACQRVQDVYASPDYMIYVVETAAAATFDKTLIRFSESTPGPQWRAPAAKFEKMLRKVDHVWTYDWKFTRYLLPVGSYCMCEVVIDKEEVVVGYADAVERAEAAVMEKLINRWETHMRSGAQYTQPPSRAPWRESFVLKVATAEQVVEDSYGQAELAIEDLFDDEHEESLEEAILAVGPGSSTPTEKATLNIFEAAIKADDDTKVLQFLHALSCKRITGGKLYKDLLKRIAHELVNDTIDVTVAERAVRSMTMLETNLTSYTRKLMDALIREEIEGCKTGKMVYRNTDIRMGDEEKKAVPAERQMDALYSLEMGKYFDPIVAEIVSDSYRAFENARTMSVKDSQLILDQFRKLCSRKPEGAKNVAESQIPLTSCQKMVVEAAMKNTLTCVRGPPGTGKTYTACAIIDNWVRSDLRVLVVAQSNAACEHLASQIARLGVDAVRLGASVSTENLLSQPAFVEKLEGRLEEFKEEAQKDVPKLMPFLKTVVEKARVVITSCIAAGHPGLLSSVRFNRVLMEEAGQITEPTAAVPLWWGAKGVCLIGDEKQLPPTVLSMDPCNPLKVSLFERLILDEVVCDAEGTFMKLDVQHRMHPSLAEFPRLVTYNDQELHDDPRVHTERPQIPGFHWPNDHRAVFIDVQGDERQERGTLSFQNSKEADIVKRLVHHFVYNAKVPEAHIAVVTGYAAQVELLKMVCQETGCSTVKVATVDSFQGSERPLVIFSTVRSGREVGFLASTQRCNVIMTRAQRGLIVIGAKDTLKCEPMYWRRWIRHIEDKGCVLTATTLGQSMKNSMNSRPPKRASSPVSDSSHTSTSSLPRNDSYGNASSAQVHRWREHQDDHDWWAQNDWSLSGKGSRKGVRLWAPAKGRAQYRSQDETSRGIWRPRVASASSQDEWPSLTKGGQCEGKSWKKKGRKVGY